MFAFQPSTFSDLAQTPTGKALWKFLNDGETLVRLETTTSLGRPALEGVQSQLLEQFGDEIRVDRWKQMIGKMTRQVMEHHGYRLDRNGVRIRTGNLFTSASRYVRPA